MTSSEPVIDACRKLIQEQCLPAEFMQVVTETYLPLADMLLSRVADQPLMVNINGAQGTGKSTLTSFLKLILETQLNAPVAAFSLDDFYSPYEQRQQTGKDIHPLLKTRGVPGTHDLELMDEVIDKLLHGKPADVPQFDKAIDDRHEKNQWHRYERPVKVVLFEGWCNHSPSQDSEQLQQPINELEANEDADGTWRQYANTRLIEYHQRVFSRADLCLMLRSPDFEHVYQWRLLQEQKLRESTPADQAHRLMDDSALKRFIQHYERITRHTLDHLPEKADITLPVRPDHSIAGIINRHAAD